MGGLGLYLQVLGLSPNATFAEVRRAYRKLVGENHPDRFPKKEQSRQEEKMVRINIAYREIKRVLDNSKPLISVGEAEQNLGSLSKSHVVSRGASMRDVSVPKDPAYSYYKQGFVCYSRGVGGMMFRGKTTKLTLDQEGLKRAIQAIEDFHQAYQYFKRVVEDYPESVWAADSYYKLYRLERFNLFYTRIQNNIKENLEQVAAANESARMSEILKEDTIDSAYVNENSAQSSD